MYVDCFACGNSVNDFAVVARYQTAPELRRVENCRFTRDLNTAMCINEHLFRKDLYERDVPWHSITCLVLLL